MTRNRSWNRNRSRNRSRNRNRIQIKCRNRNRNRLQIFRFRNPGPSTNTFCLADFESLAVFSVMHRYCKNTEPKKLACLRGWNSYLWGTVLPPSTSHVPIHHLLLKRYQDMCVFFFCLFFTEFQFLGRRLCVPPQYPASVPVLCLSFRPLLPPHPHHTPLANWAERVPNQHLVTQWPALTGEDMLQILPYYRLSVG